LNPRTVDPKMVAMSFYYLAFVMLGAAVFFMVQTVFSDEERRSASRALGNSRDGASDAGNIFLKYSRPFFSRYLVPVVADLKIESTRKDLKRKLASAGLQEILTPDELYSFKLFLILGFPILALFLRVAWEIDLPIWSIPAAGILGFYYPDKLWLNAVITARQDEVRRAMPFVVDLLALSTEAGLDFMGAIAKVVEKAKPSALIYELDVMLREVKVGSSRREALRSMAWRLNMQELNSFVAVLVSADEMGASIGKILRQQSEQIRLERFVRAEKAGAKATQAILLPMVCFIIPAIFLIIMAPFFLGAKGDEGGGGGLF
jgi:tight adherence protein C